VKGSNQFKKLAKRFVKGLRRKVAPVEEKFVPRLVHFSDNLGSFDFWIPSEEGGSWYRPEVWGHEPEYQQLEKLVKPGDRVLEIGCNIGFTTMVLSRFVGESGFVLGVDVVPDNVILAQATAFQNRAGNVRILHTGAGEAKGEMGFSNQLNGHLDSESSLKAPMTYCDALDEEFGPFNVLKVDVEGYEAGVLKGATRLLSRFPKLALEIHGNASERYGTSREDLLRLFHADRYQGTMFSRPEYQVNDFSPAELGLDALANLFLSPKSV
jgi:FkbM family methyltransferase